MKIFFFSQLSSSAGVWVFRTYEDFVWLRQSLFSQENLPGLQGIIVSELSNSQLNIIAWQRYCKALEFYLQQVAAHPTLCKCNALDSFLINSESPGRHQAVEERRKESHKNERNKNINLAALSKVATEVHYLSCFSLALACGHFSTSLHLCVNQDDAARNFEKVGSNNLSTLGLGLDLESRYQEAEKEMLFRRTCKLIELKSVKKSTKKAKANKREVVCINLRYVICYIMARCTHPH
uniref:PX domain-containing protein n=1 Tax=Cyprinus carpio TaxID=7962 RepID=A0A8C2BFS8_CYPCA